MDTFNNKGLAPGKKALVIHAKRCPENIGKIVEVVEWREAFSRDGAGFVWPDRGWWCCGEGLRSTNLRGEIFIETEAVFPPEYLMPLDDDEGMCDNSSEEQTKEKESVYEE